MAKKMCAIVCMVLLLVLLAGCSASVAPTTTPAKAPTATAQPVATATSVATPTAAPTPTPVPVKAIELKLSFGGATIHHSYLNVAAPFAAELEKQSGGRVKVTIYPAETLNSNKDMYDAAVNGIADISFVIQSYTPGRFPISQITELPFAFPDALTASQAARELFKAGYYDKEFADVKVLGVPVTSSYHIFTTKPITSLSDLKGMKIRTPGGYATDALKAVGAVPVAMVATDLYLSLQRGTVDGAAISYASAPGYKLQEVSKYVTEVSMGALSLAWVMNKQKWNSLPPDVQKIAEQLGYDILTIGHAKSYDGEDARGKQKVIDAGGKVTVMSPDERAKWTALVKPIWDNWANDMESKGLPGKAVYNKLFSIMSQIGVTAPF